MIKTIDKILYVIVAPFIFGVGFMAGFMYGQIKRLVKLWKESRK